MERERKGDFPKASIRSFAQRRVFIWKAAIEIIFTEVVRVISNAL